VEWRREEAGGEKGPLVWGYIRVTDQGVAGQISRGRKRKTALEKIWITTWKLSSGGGATGYRGGPQGRLI